MPPTTPIIDPRGFQDLVDEAKRRIPQYCPEWTDHNVSDPGVTLIELFAWMTDILLYRLNKVPERDYLKFLELIGARPHPAVPASADLLFWLTAPQPETKLIPRSVEIATRQTETRPAVIFSTDSDLRVRVPKLKYCILARRQEGVGGDGYVYEDVTSRLAWERADISVFQEQPVEEDAFYLGFEENMAAHVIRLGLRCEALRAPNINQDDPPITWEFWNGDKWAPLFPSEDELSMLTQLEEECADLGPRLDNTRGLNRNGRVLLLVPRTCVMKELRVETRALKACWFRCRAARRRPEDRFYDRSPLVHGFVAESIGGMVAASHASEISTEELGRSNGDPGQRFALHNPPILPRRQIGDNPETVDAQREDGSFEQWVEVESFADSSPADSHFIVDNLTGEVQFGPRLREPGGQERQYGRVPPKGRLIRFTRYRTGGGSIGNVGRGTLTVPKSSSDLSYLKWVANLRPATGGRDRETLDDFKLRGPKLVRSREVAITRADFEYLAMEATPRVARVRCIPAGGGGKAGAEGAVSRHIRLLIVPSVATVDEFIPRAQLELSGEARRELCRKIRLYLEERCPLTTELNVTMPEYRWVSVRARLVVKARPDMEAIDRERDRNRIQEEATRRLYRLIHPTTGGAKGDGWPFGKSLTLGDVYPLLQDIPGIEYVEEVRFRPVSYGSDGTRKVGGEERVVRLSDTEMLCSDLHEIEIMEE